MRAALCACLQAKRQASQVKIPHAGEKIHGEDLVARLIEIYWPLDRMWYVCCSVIARVLPSHVLVTSSLLPPLPRRYTCRVERFAPWKPGRRAGRHTVYYLEDHVKNSLALTSELWRTHAHLLPTRFLPSDLCLYSLRAPHELFALVTCSLARPHHHLLFCSSGESAEYHYYCYFCF